MTGLLLAATGTGASQTLKQTLARLDSVSPASKLAAVDEVAMLKREELLSSIPWFDRWLRSLDLFGRLRMLLLQGGPQLDGGGCCWPSWGAGRWLRRFCTCAREPWFRPY